MEDNLVFLNGRQPQLFSNERQPQSSRQSRKQIFCTQIYFDLTRYWLNGRRPQMEMKKTQICFQMKDDL